jgi:uncharacterized membrane protein
MFYRYNILATTLITFTLLAPTTALSQTRHDEAERAQTRSDHRHHTGAKIVGGSAAGGAVVGALAGGGKGALIGGAIGAAGGGVANHVRKQNDVKKRERSGRY